MIVNPGLKRSNGSLIGRLFRSASFYAPLQTSLLPSKSVGSPTPTYSRATAATVMGYAPTANSGDAQVLLTCASGEARFAGARRVSQDVWSNLYADGTAIASTSLLGYYSEPAAIQLIATTADIRDMTTASWTLGATLTRARTSVGIDGVANSANRLTGGAVAATNRISYSYTAAAVNRTYSCYIKRVTGTGPVLITMDNWATSTDISGQLVSGTWVLVSQTQNNLNPIVGLQVSTNNDAIDVDVNQIEAGAIATSRILTGGATKNGDSLTYTDTSNISYSLGSFYIEASLTAVSGANNIIAAPAAGGGYFVNNNQSPVTGVAKCVSFDVTNVSAAVALSGASNTINKYGCSWGANLISAVKGVTGNNSFDGSIGSGVISMNAPTLYGNLRNIYCWNLQLTASQLASMTA